MHMRNDDRFSKTNSRPHTGMKLKKDCVCYATGLGDFYQLGTYAEGAVGTTGTFKNLTALTCTDAFVIGTPTTHITKAIV